MVLDLHWVADDITATEAEGVEHIIDLWRSDQGLGQLVIDLPWVVDGVTPNEQIDLQGLAIIAYSDPPLAYQFFRSMEGLMSQPGYLPAYALASAGQIGEDPDKLRPLTERPWLPTAWIRKRPHSSPHSCPSRAPAPICMRTYFNRTSRCPRRPTTAYGRYHHLRDVAG